MEIILNLAWALCSLALVLAWWRTSASNRTPRSMQIFALAMVVLLLLPVISLSDDLLAAQSPLETDTCIRRAHQQIHPSVAPPSLAMPEQIFNAVPSSGSLQQVIEAERLSAPNRGLARAFYSRPPPQA